MMSISKEVLLMGTIIPALDDDGNVTDPEADIFEELGKSIHISLDSQNKSGFGYDAA